MMKKNYKQCVYRYIIIDNLSRLLVEWACDDWVWVFGWNQIFHEFFDKCWGMSVSEETVKIVFLGMNVDIEVKFSTKMGW